MRVFRVTVTVVMAASLLLAAVAIGERSPSGLLYSTASNNTIQEQAAPRSCDMIGSGLYSRPDPRCTPGTLNPQVTQATIGRTICRHGRTSTVRPRESVTEPEKLASMRAYFDRGGPSGYEYDHFVPLELGGATNDARNLWPEPGGSPNPKDRVENQLNHAVCDRQISLAQAQHEIATNWVALAHRLAEPAPKSSRPAEGSAPRSAAWCSASAAYSSYYHDYDVYVHSNQPDQRVTVSGAGQTANWRTDGSGYADVYFHAGPSAAGEPVTVDAGAATCSTTL